MVLQLHHDVFFFIIIQNAIAFHLSPGRLPPEVKHVRVILGTSLGVGLLPLRPVLGVPLHRLTQQLGLLFLSFLIIPGVAYCIEKNNFIFEESKPKESQLNVIAFQVQIEQCHLFLVVTLVIRPKQYSIF